jgi:hypothetical protein
MRAIPLSVGILSLSFAAAGCSDAKVVANAFEKLCKANCECPEDDYYSYGWSEVKNCKKWCGGYATAFEAELLDRETEACDDVAKIAKELASCAKKSCGEARNNCVSEKGEKLDACWPYDDYYYQYGDAGGVPNDEQPIERELRQTLLYGPFAAQ